MKNRDSGAWLEAVLVGAQDAGWCMTPYCTMCACLDFRWAYWAAAAGQAGMVHLFESIRPPQDMFVGVSHAERAVIVRTLVAGLRQLPSRWSSSEGFRTIIIDLDPPFIIHGVPMDLDGELSDTPAGEASARMREHAEDTRARREQERVNESPQAVEERRRVKREKRAITHANRQSETRRRNAERSELIADLVRLTPKERLSRFATDPATNLDAVPAELIPAQERDLVDLEKAEALALLTRIDRRKGAWGGLRRMLEQLLKRRV